MSLKGHDLAVDLSRLRMIGTVDLPLMAYVYASLNNLVADSANDAAAFAQPVVASDQAGPIWTELRNLLQNALGNTSAVLDETGHTILRIADLYAETDAAAAQELNNVWAGGPPAQLFVSGELLVPGPPAPIKQA
ncbi:hypothetical protein [Dactylosporangium sp. NPDC048998]|uniref:hypothetical protein n=1 Tax=Dactylosporangium sp. NPDC048998 TaxID=3363976 RepID=UPI003711246C